MKDVPESQHRNELFLGQFVKNYMQSEGVTVEAAALESALPRAFSCVSPFADAFSIAAKKRLYSAKL